MFSGVCIVGLDFSEELFRIGEWFVDYLCVLNFVCYWCVVIEMVYVDGVVYDYGVCDIIILLIYIENKVEIVEWIIEMVLCDCCVIVIE